MEEKRREKLRQGKSREFSRNTLFVHWKWRYRMGSPNEGPNTDLVGHTYSSPLSLETNPGLPDRKHFFFLIHKDSSEKQIWELASEKNNLFKLTNVSQIFLRERVFYLPVRNSIELAWWPGDSRNTVQAQVTSGWYNPSVSQCLEQAQCYQLSDFTGAA